jgi:hypothetical protein
VKDSSELSLKLLKIFKIFGKYAHQKIKSYASFECIICDRRVKVRWDSGQTFIYRIGAEDAYDLRVSSLRYFD